MIARKMKLLLFEHHFKIFLRQLLWEVKLKKEARTDTKLAFDKQLTIHLTQYFIADRQSETNSMRINFFVVEPNFSKHFKKLCLIFLFNSDTIIFYWHLDFHQSYIILLDLILLRLLLRLLVIWGKNMMLIKVWNLANLRFSWLMIMIYWNLIFSRLLDGITIKSITIIGVFPFN